MKVIKSEYNTFWDVDGTLVSHDLDFKGPTVCVDDPVSGRMIEVVENEAMTRLMREEKHRGAYIVVWSRGGYEWAANVIKALGLEDAVDAVMSKPVSYMDDLPVQDWLQHRVYLPFTAKYKNVHTD
jgi:hypothetical protein